MILLDLILNFKKASILYHAWHRCKFFEIMFLLSNFNKMFVFLSCHGVCKYRTKGHLEIYLSFSLYWNVWCIFSFDTLYHSLNKYLLSPWYVWYYSRCYCFQQWTKQRFYLHETNTLWKDKKNKQQYRVRRLERDGNEDREWFYHLFKRGNIINHMVRSHWPILIIICSAPYIYQVLNHVYGL